MSTKIVRLEEEISSLQKICQDLDPYAPLSNEVKCELQRFGIYEFTDPFTITNQLLVTMEDAIEKLHNLRHQERKPFVQ